MSKAVLISIQPKWCELIASGRKTIEIRKSKPKLETPFKCYIYCTNKRPFLVWGDVFRGNWETEFTSLYGYSRKEADKIWDVFNGNVMGEFVCDKIYPVQVFENKAIQHWNFYDLERARVPYDDMANYIGAGKIGCGWHISDLVIYDTPKDLREFKVRDYGEVWSTPRTLEKPPQSWCYVEEL